MTHSHPNSTVSPTALSEFTKAAQADWQGGVPLAELLARVNRVAVLLLGDDDQVKSSAGRVQRIFTDRSFRHYQTLGCIDVPEKHGRLAHYGLRHFLQALLVRKLLWERLPSEQIATMLVGCGTEDLERMLLGGVEIVARPGGGGDEGESPGSGSRPAEMWNRVRVAHGLELHISTELPRYKPQEFRRVLECVKEALRRHGS